MTSFRLGQNSPVLYLRIKNKFKAQHNEADEQTIKGYVRLLTKQQMGKHLMFGRCSVINACMIRHINEPVSVGLLIDEERRLVTPKWVRWQNKRYEVAELGFHHTFRKGIKKIHVFSVNVGVLDMRLEMDAESFTTRLTEISDGLPD